jgi:predicted peptidase
MKTNALLTLALAALLIPMPKAKAQPGAQTPQAFEAALTRAVNLKYLLYLPQDYDATAKKRWPLLLFLHGAGERGTNLSQVAVHGPPKLIKQGTHFPFLVVSPQCPNNQRWQDDALLGLLDQVTEKYSVDTNRVWLSGLSMGGYGSWSLASKYPERFAAVAPICGGGEIIDVLLSNRRQQAGFKTFGIWAFHGGKDPVVPLSESERMVAAFKRAGCPEVELTVYPEAGHDSWTEAYNDARLWEWFQKHGRK